ncbi:hypothetical protein EMGBD1_20380 [Anaerolineaceae bacterium]|nr:hypothetical protein EMGBD1_20380 [Anaerolineaceae bacterium]
MHMQPEEDGPGLLCRLAKAFTQLRSCWALVWRHCKKQTQLRIPGCWTWASACLCPALPACVECWPRISLAAGDSLPNLLYRLRSDLPTLVRLNRLVNPAALFLGQSFLFLAGDDEQPVLSAQHAVVVQPGETLALLAARAGLTMQQLALTNQLSSLAAAPGLQLQLPAPAENSLPLPFQSITVYPDHPAQGEPLAVVLTLASAAVLSGEFDGEPLHFSQLGTGQIALHGVNAITEPGVYALRVRAQPPRGAAVNVELRVRVSNAHFAHS